MKFATFYLLSQENKQKNNTFNHIEKLIFNLTITKWRSGKTIFIACENRNQAQKIDNLLWIFDKNTFLPHDFLQNSILHTPIVIYWPKCCYETTTKDILINLMKKDMDFFINFNEIIDFVPISKNLKKLARNRYQSYKNTGFQLNITEYSLKFTSN